MSSGIERCPHCHAPLAGYTNGFGGCYLQCLDCGYYEGIQRVPSPYPDKIYLRREKNGTTRTRRRHAHVPNGTYTVGRKAS